MSNPSFQRSSARVQQSLSRLAPETVRAHPVVARMNVIIQGNMCADAAWGSSAADDGVATVRREQPGTCFIRRGPVLSVTRVLGNDSLRWITAGASGQSDHRLIRPLCVHGAIIAQGRG